jgi:peptide/histidine transporter 3/4
MEGRIGGGFEMPPGSMQVFTALAAAVFAPAYDYVLVPAVRKRTGRARGLTTLQRMGSGIALSIVAMAVAAIVEKKRLSAAAAESSPELIDVPFSTLPISIFWLVPQYAILGIALVFAIVGQMDFFYSEVSDGMRSVGISLPLVCRGLGNYVSTLLVTIVDRHLGWIPANLNRAHLDYFYWLLAALMAATLAFYVVAAHFYTYLHDDGDGDECRKHKEVGLTPPNKTLNPKP